jgi:hypothetical protein
VTYTRDPFDTDHGPMDVTSDYCGTLDDHAWCDGCACNCHVPGYLDSLVAKPTHWECNCVPDLGPTHCHGCSEAEGHPVTWADRACPCRTSVDLEREP